MLSCVATDLRFKGVQTKSLRAAGAGSTRLTTGAAGTRLTTGATSGAATASCSCRCNATTLNGVWLRALTTPEAICTASSPTKCGPKYSVLIQGGSPPAGSG